MNLLLYKWVVHSYSLSVSRTYVLIKRPLFFIGPTVPEITTFLTL